MILVTGTITFDADKADTLLSAVAELVPATLAEEGCIDYGFWLSPTEPGVVRVVEQWADEAALNAHFATMHMATFMGAMGDCGISATDIWRHDVAQSSKLM